MDILQDNDSMSLEQYYSTNLLLTMSGGGSPSSSMRPDGAESMQGQKEVKNGSYSNTATMRHFHLRSPITGSLASQQQQQQHRTATSFSSSKSISSSQEKLAIKVFNLWLI